MELKIDAEFRDLIPPLSGDELTQLKENLIAYGCRDPLVVWQGENILVDGHNRYALCLEHGIAFTVTELPFEDRSAVKVWIILNQFGRRNISDFVRRELALKLKEVIAAKAKENLRAAGGDKKSDEAKSPFSNLKKAIDPIHTYKELAKLAETSIGSLHKTEVILDKAPAFIKEAARAGDMSTDRAYKLTRALENAPAPVLETARAYAGDSVDKVNILKRMHASQDKVGSNGTFAEIATTGGFHYGEDMNLWCDFRAASVEEVAAALRSLEKHHRAIATAGRLQEKLDAIQQAPPETFSVVYADPPWAYTNSGFDYAAERYYPTLSTDRICTLLTETGLSIGNPAALFLWATNPLLPDALRVLGAWGFIYKTNMVWDKGQHYAGFYVLGEHELLLLATRGSFLPACKPHSVIRSRRTQHSSKPDMYEVIETMYPGQRYIELFARNNAPRQGWTFWGLEANV